MKRDATRRGIAKPVVLVLSGLMLAVTSLSAGLPVEGGWRYRQEVYASVGAGRFYNGSHNWGSGLQLGGGFGLRPFAGALRKLGLEARVHHLSYGDGSNPAYSSPGEASSVTAGVLWHFSSSGVQPYVMAEFGEMRTRFTNRWIVGYTDSSGQDHMERWTRREQASQFLWGAGVGMKMRLAPHLYLRPELRFDTTTVGSGWNFATVRFSAGCGYYW